MRRRLFKQILNPWALCLSLIVWIALGSFLVAGDLPSGLPDDLSDMTAYNPCLGNLCGISPPRCPWYFEADAIFLKRDRVDRVPFATLTIPANVVFSTSDIDSPFRTGTRALLGHTFGDTRWQIDATYLWLDNWDDSAAIRDNTPNVLGGQGNLFSPFSNFGRPAIPGYDYSNFVSVREFSQLRNCELNLRYTLPMLHECLTPKLILGLRYTSVNEQFDYFSESQTTVSTTTLSTRTTNDLFGPQIGGEFYFYANPQCWIDLSIKGALCNNRALQDTTGTLTDRAVDTPVSSRQRRDATAYVGDLDLDLVWQITPRLMTRIGYQAIWINNIAMADRNFAPPGAILENGPPQIDTLGRAVYHGPHIGLECTW